jgi:predicted TIM-barrel fold metal-dependent hydrolase
VCAAAGVADEVTGVDRLTDPIAVIDVDTHLTEPADLWTSRLPRRLRDAAPHVEWDDRRRRDRWHVGRHTLLGVQDQAHAGWKEFYPSTPASFAEADPGGWDAAARLEVMDAHGIAAQLLYPNLLGFFGFAFMELEAALSLACVTAFNDFQIEWCSADPRRLIPLAFLPFWDLEASVAELGRCADLGFRGFNWGHCFEKVGLPPLRDPHWDPVMSLAQEAGMPASFHIGFGNTTEAELNEWAVVKEDTAFAQMSVLFFLGNAAVITELCMGGICERFPRLNFVSVESGFGYVPYLLEAMDWMYKNNRGSVARRGLPLPSDYFRRQVFATFWFEENVGRLIDLLPDNVMFETDYPHPTSLSPGPGSIARDAKTTIAHNLGSLPEEIRRNVLHDTAARLYRLDV